MKWLTDFLHGDTAHKLLSILLFIGTILVVYLIYRYILKKLSKRVAKTATLVDDFIVDLLKFPIMVLLFWIVLRIFTAYSFISQTSFYNTVAQINDILLIGTFGWILIKVVRIIFYYTENKLEHEGNGANIRSSLTKLKIFEGIIVTILTVLIVAFSLMTFDKVRSIGISLLTSAGIAGIIVGLAAQKSIGAILAGIQIALTQPIRLDDQVFVEGDSGNVEEINLTYIVVKIWNGKRKILPVNYFLDNPFQNWTRASGSILDSVFLYLDYNAPLDALRNQLKIFLTDHPKWDKGVATIQVTNTNPSYMEVRLLMSSFDASTSFDLLADIREKMIVFLNTNYPECFAKTRIIDTSASKNGKTEIGREESATPTVSEKKS